MKDVKKKLIKLRLASAILASLEFANVGVTSLAMMPSSFTDPETQPNLDFSFYSDFDEHISNIKEMENMSPDELLQYLATSSTPDALKYYYDNEMICKSRQDTINFNSVNEDKRHDFFDYILGLISEGQLVNFSDIPIEIRGQFFDYVITQGYDLFDIFAGLGLPEYDLTKTDFKDFMDEMLTVVPPRTAGMIFSRFIYGNDNQFMNAILSGDYNSITRVPFLDFDFNKEDVANGCNLIDFAALIGRMNIFKFFLSNDVEITENTIAYALMGGNVDIIREVASRQEIDFEKISQDNKVLSGIISANREDLFEWLHLHTEDMNMLNVAYACCKTGNLPFLVKVFENINSEDLDDLLVCAALNGNINIASFLLAKGANINKNSDDTALKSMIHFVINQCSKMYDFIHKNPETNDVVYKNLVERNVEKIRLLIDEGADVDAIDDEGNSALLYLTEEMLSFVYHDKEFFEHVANLLLENSYNVNATNSDGESALSIAAKSFEEVSPDIAQILIHKGADVSTLSQELKDTLLGWFVDFDVPDNYIARLLIQNGADINNDKVEEREKIKFFLWALKENDVDLVKFLIETGGIDITKRDDSGYTILMHYAASSGANVEMANLLLENGAVASMKDNNGRTAVVFAFFAGNYALGQFLDENVFEEEDFEEAEIDF